MTRTQIPTPTEDQEQRTVCEWLDLHGIVYCHVPNGGARKRVEAAILQGLGVKKGFPDLVIFTPPPRDNEHRGLVIEMKRKGRQKEKNGGVTDEQQDWLIKLSALGWFTNVCYGADDAIDLLERLGYGRRWN